jgi:2-polyprenyl-3-methyl-5-hydroxy-6-metoxy-1,4-benzoquinol methylase
MDRLLKRFDSTQHADLTFCLARGVAFQRDMKAARKVYDSGYLSTFQSPAYVESPTARAVVGGRVAMVERHLGKRTRLIDVGACSGAFLRAAHDAGYHVKGFDIIPDTVSMLIAANWYCDDPAGFDAVTMWDVIEHMEDPEIWLSKVSKDALLFASIPQFGDLRRLRESKHYKPGEHLYYWTPRGFVEWMALHGFRLIETSEHEMRAGRQDIGAYAFRRDLPDYRDHIEAYRQMHAGRHYGSSATELHLDAVAAVVRHVAPHSVLDFGCGRSDLVAHFWLDGRRRLARYDPAIPAFRDMPGGEFDLALCCDVLEHIPMSAVDKVLLQVRRKSARAMFTISTRPSRARLPDGRNAHVTLLTRSEWTRWIADYFGAVEALPSALTDEIVLLAGAVGTMGSLEIAA